MTFRLARSAGDLASTRETRVPTTPPRPRASARCALKLISRCTPSQPRGSFLVFDESAGSSGDDVDGNREADALVAAGGAGDGRVEADDFAAQIHERSAAVARVDGGIGLNEVLELELFVAEVEIVPAFGAHDSAGDALAEAEWAADGEYEIADLERIAISQASRFQSAGVDRQRGHVGLTIAPNLRGVEDAAVVQMNFDSFGRRMADHVAIGKHVEPRV